MQVGYGNRIGVHQFRNPYGDNSRELVFNWLRPL